MQQRRSRSAYGFFLILFFSLFIGELGILKPTWGQSPSPTVTVTVTPSPTPTPPGVGENCSDNNPCRTDDPCVNLECQGDVAPICVIVSLKNPAAPQCCQPSCGNGVCEPGADDPSACADCSTVLNKRLTSPTGCTATVDQCNANTLDGCCPGTVCGGQNPDLDCNTCSTATPTPSPTPTSTPTPTPTPFCGNGQIDPDSGEECEPPNSFSCDANCKDRTGKTGDACTPACALPADPNCQAVECRNNQCITFEINNPQTLNCKPKLDTCGDGIVQAPETCDLGVLNGVDGASCSYNCQPVFCQIPGDGTCALCGNGIKEGNEECDSGQANGSETCTNTCKIAAPKCVMEGGGGGCGSAAPLCASELNGAANTQLPSSNKGNWFFFTLLPIALLAFLIQFKRRRS